MLSYINKKPRILITGRQGILLLWKLTQNSPGRTIVYITGQCTLHNVCGKVTVIRLCILILFLNKKPKRLKNSQLLRKTWSHLKIAHAHNVRYFNFFIVPPYCPLKTVQWTFHTYKIYSILTQIEVKSILNMRMHIISAIMNFCSYIHIHT